jgi:hypothetical protein
MAKMKVSYGVPHAVLVDLVYLYLLQTFPHLKNFNQQSLKNSIRFRYRRVKKIGVKACYIDNSIFSELEL